MSDVEFLEEQKIDTFGSRRVFGAPELPSAVRFLMRVGIVKKVKTGYYFMVALTILFFAAAVLIVYVYVFNGSIFPHSSPGSGIIFSPGQKSVIENVPASK